MELYSWETLGTLAGASAATLLVVQYLKLPIERLLKIRTRLLVLLVALAILVCARAFGPAGIQLRDVPLLALNAVMVALSAMGAYENTFAAGDSGGGA